MIHPGEGVTATVRTVFFIDDKGIVRAMIYYPMSCGRNIDEVVRVLDALQTADKNGVACPVNWKPGDKVIVPPPQTIADAEKRLQSDYEITDWYFARRTLS
jgi:peroxiredoxin (alkyl hydroperoxide reductase subunit C)